MLVYNVTIEIPDKDYFEVLLIFLKTKSIMSIQHCLFINTIYSQTTVWFLSASNSFYHNSVNYNNYLMIINLIVCLNIELYYHL